MTSGRKVKNQKYRPVYMVKYLTVHNKTVILTTPLLQYNIM